MKKKKNWLIIRNKLNQNYFYDDNWEDAIILFDNRLKQKFFNPLQQIIDKKPLKGEGFSILTVQCALIEMFAPFRKGKIFNHNRTNTSPRYEYKESQKMFTSLLRTASVFKDNFWQLNIKNKVVIPNLIVLKTFIKMFVVLLCTKQEQKKIGTLTQQKNLLKQKENLLKRKMVKLKFIELYYTIDF